MDALVIALAVALSAFVIGFVLLALAYMKAERACERLRWTLDRTEAYLVAERAIKSGMSKVIREQEKHIAQLLATRSQQNSQESQPEAPEVVRVLPVAASRLARYVKEQAMANGETLSDHEAERMAAAMLVESGI